MPILKNDFIEVEFTARIKGNNEVFDTTVLEDAKKAKLMEKFKLSKFNTFPFEYLSSNC